MKLTARSWALFVVAVLIWGTTWHAIVYQLAEGSPELGVALRFSLGGLGVLAWQAWRGERLRLTARQHAGVALQGVFMYSVSYLCVYHAERHVPSGLVSVGYSASPLVLGLGAWLLWRTRTTARLVVGGVLGVVGVALIFWPEFARADVAQRTALGAALTVGAVLLSAVGSLAAQHNQGLRIPFWPALGWGMVYGSLLSWAAVPFDGRALAWPVTPGWWLSLAYLTVFGSVVAFACYLELQRQLGVAAASTVGVATPVLALVVSALFEGYRPDLLSGAGIVLAIAGNLAILGVGLKSDGARATG